MKKRLVQSKKRYVAAFAIGTALFIALFGLSYFFADLQYQRISNMQIKTAYSVLEGNSLYQVFDESICSDESFKKVSEELAFQGESMDDLENKFGKTNDRVLERKEFYTLMLLEHFGFVKALNEKCDKDIRTILFFYSNSEDEEISREVGRILDVVSLRNENVVIYSFDINLDSELMRKLKVKYAVDISPTVIINEKYKIYNPRSSLDIERLVNEFEQN